MTDLVFVLFKENTKTPLSLKQHYLMNSIMTSV